LLCRIVGGAFAAFILIRMALELYRTGRLSMSEGHAMAASDVTFQGLIFAAILIACAAR